jgi:hypothetical protein
MVCFFEFLAPLLWKARTFSFLIHFVTIVSVSDAARGGAFKFCLDTKKNETLPLDPVGPEHLSVWSPAGLP